MNSDRLLQKVTRQWLLMFLITLGIAAFFLHPDIRVNNIGNIQFSQSFEDFRTNISEHLMNIKLNTLYDFLFIVAYSILFYLTYRMFQSSMRIPVSKLWIILCFLPGIFDIVENILLLNLLDHTESTWMFNVFWLVVRAKWTFAIPFAIINFTILVYYFIRIINSFFS